MVFVKKVCGLLSQPLRPPFSQWSEDSEGRKVLLLMLHLCGVCVSPVLYLEKPKDASLAYGIKLFCGAVHHAATLLCQHISFQRDLH